MPSLKSLRSNREKTPIPYGEQTITFVWIPALLTGKFWQQLVIKTDLSRTASGEDAARAIDEVREHIVPLIAEWDMTEDDEITPLPINADSLGELPDGLIRRFVDEIMGYGQQGKASSSGDSGGPAEGQPAPSLDGRHSFG